MENWVIQELKSLDIGDSRLDKRVKHILNSLSRSPEESIPVSCRTWSETKAAYHCFSNDKVSANKIMAPDKENIIERAQQFKRVLVLQDTTELNYSGQKEKQGVAPKKHKDERNLFLHPQLVISESGVCLGVYEEENTGERQPQIWIKQVSDLLNPCRRDRVTSLYSLI